MIPSQMTAAVLFGPGDLRLQQVAVPKPGADEVLIKVEACAICGSDPKIIKNGWPGSPPFGEFIPGHEYAGIIVEKGAGANRFQVGDRVVVEPHKGCGQCINCLRGLYTTCLNYGKNETGHRHYGFTCNGGYAEYAVNHVNTVHRIPDQISFEEATLLTMAGTGLYGIERAGGIYPGETVTVIGPGPLGLACIQLAKLLGAGRTILIGTRESRLAMGQKLGADRTINSKLLDPVNEIAAITDGLGGDLTIECSGNAAAAALSVDLTRKSGRICFLGMYQEAVTMNLNKVVQYNLILAGGKAEGMQAIERAIPLMADGRLKLAPMITHVFPLAQVNDALKTFTERVGDAVKVILIP
jgi:threonine dehydrogenase-like Zn-dependent dehydrogenase